MRRIRFDRCRWVPWAIVAAFAVIFGVNGTFAYFAVHSDTGLVTSHPFAEGNGYNRVLDEAAAEAALGWRGTVAYWRTADGSGAIVAELSDAEGRPISGVDLRARVVRPLGPGAEADLSLRETTPGSYAAPVALAQLGQWEVRAIARRGDEIYQFDQRIVVR
jgi:nitrogen fixation protein FixH